MPIVEVEVIGDAPAASGLGERLARQIGVALGSPAGSVWVKLAQPAVDYAENGPLPSPLPVFVRVLAGGPDRRARAERALAIAQAVAAAVGRRRECVHVIFEPEAQGRVFFGGSSDGTVPAGGAANMNAWSISGGGAGAVKTQREMKRAVAEAALRFVQPGRVLGVGTGSTVDLFIDALAAANPGVTWAVSSSERSTARLKAIGIEVLDLNDVDDLPVYIDGADEIDPGFHMIKGGGAALTREKIIAAVARTFVCIADESKRVDVLGRFPLPVEVIPMARAYVARELARLGGEPRWRQGLITDNGNVILDVHGLRIEDPLALEARLNGIVGVVTNGLFAARGADVLLLGTVDGVREISR